MLVFWVGLPPIGYGWGRNPVFGRYTEFFVDLPEKETGKPDVGAGIPILEVKYLSLRGCLMFHAKWESVG